jgi:hypothetical protein
MTAERLIQIDVRHFHIDKFRNIQHDLTCCRQILVVLAQAPIATKPTEGSFDDPTPRHDGKASLAFGSLNYFQDPANTLFDPLDKRSTPKGAIGPNQLETAPSQLPPRQ